MITTDQVPHPSSDYKAAQEALKSAHLPDAKGLTHTQALKTLLTAEFSQSFKLYPFRRVKARKIEACLRHLCSGFMDHVTCYANSYQSVMVFVTQPYGRSPEDVARLESLQCAVVDLSEWAFYYPGKAECFAIVVTPLAEKIIQTRREMQVCPSVVALELFGAKDKADSTSVH